MISKIRSGILSCAGLIFIHMLRGIICIPGVEPENFMVNLLAIQIGSLWFTITLWIVLRYDIVILNNLNRLSAPIDWLIRNIAFVSVFGIISFLLPNSALKLLSVLLGIVLVINYVVVFVRIYKLNKNDLEYINDLQNSILSMLVILIVFFIFSLFNEFMWHMDLDFVFYFLWSVPVLFQMRYLVREKREIELELKKRLITNNNDTH